jgi:hypothetical protein
MDVERADKTRAAGGVVFPRPRPPALHSPLVPHPARRSLTMVRFTTSFKLAVSFFGLSLLVLAAQPGSITRATLSKLARDSAERGHHYVAPGKDDSRSPCPALNTLANHGYL